ncbi:MAG TPA: S9 family peptidase [Planctomycetota bacterium]|nr:S9 family peptidase [Planctomycetota bacterium]
MRIRTCSLLILLACAAGAQDGAKTPISVEDLYRSDAPKSLALSRDGAQAVYVRAWVDAETRQERNSLWLVDGSREKTRALERGEPDGRSPQFSPDGRWILFHSTRPRPQGWRQTPPAPPESDPALDLWVLPADGGDALPLSGPDKPYGRVFSDGFYGRAVFSPDGSRVAFVADDGLDPRTPEEVAADVRVVRPDQGEGYTGYRPAQIWVAQLDKTPGKSAASRIDRLTNDDVWYGSPDWSPDGRTLAVHANRTADRESVRYSINKNFDLWAIDVESKAIRALSSGPGPEVSPRFSPDGRRLACLSVPRKGSHRDTFNLCLVTLGESGTRMELLNDHNGAAAQANPVPTFPLPDDCWDGDDHLVYVGERGVASEMWRVDVKSGEGRLLEPSSRAGLMKFAGRMERRAELTPPGDLYLRERVVSETRLISWENEGLRIEGVITLPRPEVAKPPYRTLLIPHGGPHSRAIRGFNFGAQVYAARGYLVFEPNFRGSVGYGQKFIDADRFDFGGGDMRDILSGLDYLVREKLADPERQFVYGSSYGGFMTTWLVGHTRQFKAAVAVNAVTDLTMMWGLSDLRSWVEWEFGGRPWEIADALRRHSPLTYAAEVRTPTLILHSREDRRCPLPMGQIFHKALEQAGVPTEMVIYPGEGHPVKQLRHREDVFRRTLAWFDRFGK